MPDKRWESLTTGEKLDELRDGLDRLRRATFEALADQAAKLDKISASIVAIKKRLKMT